MARRNRDNLKRKVAQMYFELDRTMENALELKAAFDEHHPGLGDVFRLVMDACLTTQHLLAQFWTEAWGQDEPRWESWL